MDDASSRRDERLGELEARLARLERVMGLTAWRRPVPPAQAAPTPPVDAPPPLADHAVAALTETAAPELAHATPPPLPVQAPPVGAPR